MKKDMEKPDEKTGLFNKKKSSKKLTRPKGTSKFVASGSKKTASPKGTAKFVVGKGSR